MLNALHIQNEDIKAETPPPVETLSQVETPPPVETLSQVKTPPPVKTTVDAPYVRSSSHADFLCVGQFIGIFGPLLGLPQISLDMTEDGLDRNQHSGHDAYIEACTNAIERILIILLRRCGITTTNERLSKTLYKYFLERDLYLAGCFQNNIVYRDLSSVDKLAILKAVCLNQFDDNTKFKTDFNSKYSPEELRWEPLGRDFDSNQYWYISDFNNSHRLYKWEYPYTADNWSLISSYRDELRMVVERISPPDPQEVMEGKLANLVKECTSLSEPPRPKKKKKKKLLDDVEEDDKDVVHRSRLEEGGRRSMRNMGARKVYTESNPEITGSEEEDEEYKVSSSDDQEKSQYHKVCRKKVGMTERKRSHRKHPVSSFRNIDFTKHILHQSLHSISPCFSNSPSFSQSPGVPSTNNNGCSPSSSMASEPLTGTQGHVTVDSSGHVTMDPSGHVTVDSSGHVTVDPSGHVTVDPSGHVTVDPSGHVFDEVDKDFKENSTNGFHNNIVLSPEHKSVSSTWTNHSTVYRSHDLSQPITEQSEHKWSEAKEESKVVVEKISHTNNCTIELIPKVEDSMDSSIVDSFINIGIDNKVLDNTEDTFDFPSDVTEVKEEEEEEEEDPFDFCPPDLNDRFKGVVQGPDYVPVKRKPPPAREFLNTQVRRKPLNEPRQRRRRVVEEVYYEPAPLFTSHFLNALKQIPSISNYEKPGEAKDICWKCDGEDDVDQMLFCDGCDLATYHMMCCRPEINIVPVCDWYCPVCEQCLLYIKLRERLRRLGGRLRKPKKQRPPLTPVKSPLFKEPGRGQIAPDPVTKENTTKKELKPILVPRQPISAQNTGHMTTSTPIKSEHKSIPNPNSKKNNKSPCHYTADDFLAQPLFHKLDVTKIPQPQKRFVPYEEYELQPRKAKVMSITYDDETLSRESEKRGLSTSGHVAMDTIQLSEEQKAALVAWEQMEQSYSQLEESDLSD